MRYGGSDAPVNPDSLKFPLHPAWNISTAKHALCSALDLMTLVAGVGSGGCAGGQHRL